MSLELVPSIGQTFACCCRGEQFMVTFGAAQSPVITCQSCGQSYQVSGGGAAPFRMIGDTDAFTEYRRTAATQHDGRCDADLCHPDCPVRQRLEENGQRYPGSRGRR